MNVIEFITVDRLEAMLSAATYGVDTFSIEIPEDSKQLADTIRKMQPDICKETLWAVILVKGGNLTVIDNEEEKKYTIDRIKIASRYAMWIDTDPAGYSLFCDENEDATTGLNWLQILIFGEIIYG